MGSRCAALPGAQRLGTQHQEIPSAEPSSHTHVTPSHRHIALSPPPRGQQDRTRCWCDASKRRVLFQSVIPVGFLFWGGGLVWCFLFFYFLVSLSGTLTPRAAAQPFRREYRVSSAAPSSCCLWKAPAGLHPPPPPRLPILLLFVRWTMMICRWLQGRGLNFSMTFPGT